MIPAPDIELSDSRGSILWTWIDLNARHGLLVDTHATNRTEHTKGDSGERNKKTRPAATNVGHCRHAGIIALANALYGEGDWHFVGYGFAIPGAMALVGLVQLVGGVQFAELAVAWDDMAGWQRGILGTLIVLVAGGIAFGGLVLYGSIAYN